MALGWAPGVESRNVVGVPRGCECRERRWQDGGWRSPGQAFSRGPAWEPVRRETSRERTPGGSQPLGADGTPRRSPRRVTMPVPQITDRIKDAPGIVLRAVFAGVGQLLLAADRLRGRTEQALRAPER